LLLTAAPEGRMAALCAGRFPVGARGRCQWAGPSGIAAMLSGQAGLHDKRSCKDCKLSDMTSFDAICLLVNF
jgi:hypothetical protein